MLRGTRCQTLRGGRRDVEKVSGKPWSRGLDLLCELNPQATPFLLEGVGQRLCRVEEREADLREVVGTQLDAAAEGVPSAVSARLAGGWRAGFALRCWVETGPVGGFWSDLELSSVGSPPLEAVCRHLNAPPLRTVCVAPTAFLSLTYSDQ